MTINEVYEKYKHFDVLLSDKDWMPDSNIGLICRELWTAIKETGFPKNNIEDENE